MYPAAPQVWIEQSYPAWELNFCALHHALSSNQKIICQSRLSIIPGIASIWKVLLGWQESCLQRKQSSIFLWTQWWFSLCSVQHEGISFEIWSIALPASLPGESPNSLKPNQAVASGRWAVASGNNSIEGHIGGNEANSWCSKQGAQRFSTPAFEGWWYYRAS